jgi:hypothetical protein
MAERTLKEGGEKVAWSVKGAETAENTLKSRIESQRRALRDFSNYYAENKGKLA